MVWHDDRHGTAIGPEQACVSLSSKPSSRRFVVRLEIFCLRAFRAVRCGIVLFTHIDPQHHEILTKYLYPNQYYHYFPCPL